MSKFDGTPLTFLGGLAAAEPGKRVEISSCRS